ncbi:MAG: peptidoglycan DD-metalloendopeptidase family protein [Firmicutes bacterium]|nr:peptidoglycan DD-metalloendopeptidase family protein [Bacillota bacterium]
MKRLGKKSFVLLMCMILTTVFCCSGLAFAATESELRNDLSDVKQEQDELSKKMTQVEQDVKEVQAKVDALAYQINKSADEIANTEKKIKAKEKEMKEREENLNARLKVMYKNGSLGFVDVLLGSGSISEFVSNLEIIQKIYKNDMDVLDTLDKEHKELQAIKKQLKEKRAKLATQKDELADEKAKLDEKKKALKKEEDALKAEADRLTSEILSMIDKNSQYIGGEFTWPCPASTYITSSFGNRLHPILKSWIFHTGLDIGCSSGKDILAAASGKVIMAQVYGGYGNCVMIDHGGGIVTLYGHASKLCVSKGDVVKRGQVVAKVGSTGRSTGPHLHFEVRKNGEYVNPMKYFK